MNAVVAFRPPTLEKRTIKAERRSRNAKLRTRRYLTEAEVTALMDAARGNREGKRDATMILITFRHGLRASELVDLRWDQVDFDQAVLHVRRANNDTPATHPLTGKELRALRDLKRESRSPFVFVSMRDAPFSVSGFRRMVERACQDAGLGIKARPHMLRHACGYELANKGTDTRTIQAYLGHQNIGNTVRYTELSATRFKGLFHD
jgi:integrase